MKKYFLGIFAVMVALGLSAFNMPAKKQAAPSLSSLQFWNYDPGTGTLGGYVGVFDPSTEQADLEDATCPDDGAIQCARGYDMQFGPSNKPQGAQVNSYLDIVAHD